MSFDVAEELLFVAVFPSCWYDVCNFNLLKTATSFLSWVFLSSPLNFPFAQVLLRSFWLFVSLGLVFGVVFACMLLSIEYLFVVWCYLLCLLCLVLCLCWTLVVCVCSSFFVKVMFVISICKQQPRRSYHYPFL